MANISIIVATKNCFEKIDAMMLSLFRQEEQDFEIICVDDASTDNTLNLLHHYAEFDKRIRVIEQKKAVGLLKCCQIGLKQATAPYVMFLSGTHHLLLVQSFSERLLNSAKQFNSDTVYTPVVFMDGVMFTAYQAHIFPKEVFTSVMKEPCFAGKQLHPQLLFMLYLSPYVKLYKTEFAKTLDYDAYDEPFYLNALLKAERVTCDLDFLCYRQMSKDELERPQAFAEQQANRQVLQQNGVYDSHKHAYICDKMHKVWRAVLNAPKNKQKQMFEQMKKEFAAENFGQYDFNLLRRDQLYWVFQTLNSMSYDDFILQTTKAA